MITKTEKWTPRGADRLIEIRSYYKAEVDEAIAKLMNTVPPVYFPSVDYIREMPCNRPDATYPTEWVGVFRMAKSCD